MIKNIKITSEPEDLVEGLFGQIFLWVFEVLPYLDNQGIMPIWEIRSKLYGTPKYDYVVIPGLIEPNYDLLYPIPEAEELSLLKLREKELAVMGNDWQYISSLWKKYFRIPDRIIRKADGMPKLDAALGLHYRGTDKNKSLDETNFVSESDFMTLAGDFLAAHPEVQTIFIASDERSFVERFRAEYPGYQIVSSGDVIHHKEIIDAIEMKKGDHAVLDCVLLSRCRYLLKCQSALSGFCKVLNPAIEAYRISANKLPDWNREIPYFPDGYLPTYQSKNPEVQAMLERLFEDDWTLNRDVFGQFGKMFRYQKRTSYSWKARRIFRKLCNGFR